MTADLPHTSGVHNSPIPPLRHTNGVSGMPSAAVASARSGEPFLTAERLSWAAGGTPVLDDVTCTLRPDVVTGVVGPNGSGKTTLLHLLGGLRRPAYGTVRLRGEDVHRMPSRERAQRVALVEQHPSTTLDLTVRDVVALGLVPHRGRWPFGVPVDDARLDDAMRRVEMDALADRSWATLSGGERQRAHLARALVQGPELLLLDEPTNHLDVRHQLSFLSTIVALGMSTVVVLHDLDLAAAFCDDLVVLDGGRLAAHGPAEDVLTSDLVAQVFGVAARVEHTDRLRVTWQGLADRDATPRLEDRSTARTSSASPTVSGSVS